MRRSFAHVVAAASTILLLEGASFGIATGLAFAGTEARNVRTFDATHLAATTAWVVLLLAPVVAWLETRRRRVWLAALAAGLLAAAVRLALDGRAASSAASAWSLVDGIGLAVGLLVYDLVFGLLRDPPRR